ncbi:MAG: zinc-ribbon domain-containing protein [Eubacteriales bacterium]
MALIHCPECGKEISDKAEKCIHCGHVMKEQPKIICEDCGNEIPEGAETCPVCDIRGKLRNLPYICTENASA